jgi:histidinol-phosphate/aromatic aminotransferase/cobyric acid decarboxylase-like protein
MTSDRRKLLKQLGLGMAARSLLRTVSAEEAVNEATASGRNSVPHAGSTHLGRNENPYGASKKAIAAIQESASQANLYPETGALQKALAIQHDVRPEQILLRCGSSDVLRMAAAAFLPSGNRLILGKPTCGLIAGYAREQGLRFWKFHCGRTVRMI